MVGRIISALGFGLVGACWAGNPVETVRELPDIVELRIVDSRTVYMKSSGQLFRLFSDGGLVEDRHYIEAETGVIKLGSDAREPNEITMTLGEHATSELGHGGNTFRLLEINGKVVKFHHVQVLRNSKRVERDVLVFPYGAPRP